MGRFRSDANNEDDIEDSLEPCHYDRSDSSEYSWLPVADDNSQVTSFIEGDFASTPTGVSQEVASYGQVSIDTQVQTEWLSSSPIVIGDPTHEFEPKPISKALESGNYRPDTVLDAWSTKHFAIRAASVRGAKHRYAGLPRQDDLAIKLKTDNDAVIIAVADGVSSASHSHLAATVVTRYVTQWLYQCNGETYHDIDWNTLMSHASNALVNQAHQIQQSAGNNLSDIRAIVATTIVCAVVYPSISKDCLCVNLASVGDSGAYILDENSIKPICGGKKSDDILFVENITSCLPDNCCVPDTIQFEILPGQLLLLATDGIGDALGDGTGLVSDTFSTIFRSRIPSIIEFAHLTDFSRKSFIDDRSLVALWPR